MAEMIERPGTARRAPLEPGEPRLVLPAVLGEPTVIELPDWEPRTRREPHPDPARMVVLDYSGHPCQVQLSRILAGRGHTVTHLYCAGYSSGKGNLDTVPGDPATLTIRQTGGCEPVRRYAVWHRLRHELEFPGQAMRLIREADPSVVLLSNVPLLALFFLTARLRAQRLPYVFWQQDVYSRALSAYAVKVLGPLGRPLGWVARTIERRIARGAASIVPINDAFLTTLDQWGVGRDKVNVVPNWAALDEMPSRPRDNAWARQHDLDLRPVVMYSGTLGLKHDPSVLLEIARALDESPTDGCVVVISEGPGREWLAEHGGDLKNLILLDYQPYRDLPDVLASADVLVALLEPEAGAYSVPSKVLNYLCAGRPVVGVMPPVNGAATTITEAGAGLVFDGRSAADVPAAVVDLIGDDRRRAVMGANARRFAELNFDARAVGDRFEPVLDAARRRPVAGGVRT